MIPDPQARILVVDDCRMTTLLVRYVLSRAGLASETVANGLEALERALCGEHDLIFLDIVLPGMSGIEVARRLRVLRPDHSCRIVLMTGLGEDWREEMLAEAGAETVLFKPLSPTRIIETVRQLPGEITAPEESLRSEAALPGGRELPPS